MQQSSSQNHEATFYRDPRFLRGFQLYSVLGAWCDAEVHLLRPAPTSFLSKPVHRLQAFRLAQRAYLQHTSQQPSQGTGIASTDGASQDASTSSQGSSFSSRLTRLEQHLHLLAAEHTRDGQTNGTHGASAGAQGASSAKASSSGPAASAAALPLTAAESNRSGTATVERARSSPSPLQPHLWGANRTVAASSRAPSRSVARRVGSQVLLTAPGPAHPTVQPLLELYLSMAQADMASAGLIGFDRPKGVGKLFVTLCRPTDAVDLRDLTKAGLGVFAVLCRYSLLLAAVLIPAWLWLVRVAWRDHGVLPGALVAAAGCIFWLLADALNTYQEQEAAARHRGVITASQPAGLQLVPPPGYRPPASSGAGAPGAGAATHHATDGGHAPAGHSPRAAHAGRPRALDSEIRIKQIKQYVIKLENALFGNEVSEGDLPKDQLPVRVRKLCEEVGVTFDADKARTSEALVALCKQVEQAVGLGAPQ